MIVLFFADVIGKPGTESGHRVEQVDPRIPWVFGVHKELPERHVYADIMHMVDCALNHKKPVVSAEHARHVMAQEAGEHDVAAVCRQRDQARRQQTQGFRQNIGQNQIIGAAVFQRRMADARGDHGLDPRRCAIEASV